MKTTILTTFVLTLAIAFIAGCGESRTAAPEAETKTDAHDHSAHTSASEDSATAGDHSGWWCVEHGIPEDVCSMCDSKVAAEFQRKGDWCDGHNRAKSQCFHCDPALEQRFAVQYEARYGKQPPKPIE